ncbi:MAG: type II secretion system minor pseudopilin GspI [Woeseiaceae bacterium]|nr:type II secretion system minor pseudopilin GspI [Woeseiaceae bacterium]
MTPERRLRGFTLIEVMVALAIAALSLASVMAAVSQMVDAANAMRERTYASWIAQNKIAEMRLANVIPEITETDGEVRYAGQAWTWTATVSETGVENLFRVDVAVGLAETGASVRSVTGFIGEPVAPGLANAAWAAPAAPRGERQ